MSREAIARKEFPADKAAQYVAVQLFDVVTDILEGLFDDTTISPAEEPEVRAMVFTVLSALLRTGDLTAPGFKK